MVKFYCPKHDDVVLYEENDSSQNDLSFTTIDRPEFCQKCDKNYYKWECHQMLEDQALRDDK